MRYTLAFLLNLFFIITLTACMGDEDISGDPGSPGYAATEYFYALYNKKDLDEASKYTTDKLERIMRSYGSPSQFARNIINLQYDKVSIDVDRSDVSVREQYDNNATISLIFTGYFNGEKIDEFRSVKMVKEFGFWKVDEILPDPWAK